MINILHTFDQLLESNTWRSRVILLIVVLLYYLLVIALKPLVSFHGWPRAYIAVLGFPISAIGMIIAWRHSLRIGIIIMLLGGGIFVLFDENPLLYLKHYI